MGKINSRKEKLINKRSRQPLKVEGRKPDGTLEPGYKFVKGGKGAVEKVTPKE